MWWEIALRVHVMRLYNGRRSFYGAVVIGRRRLWLQRWDTARAPENRWRTRDGVMGWTGGVSRA